MKTLKEENIDDIDDSNSSVDPTDSLNTHSIKISVGEYKEQFVLAVSPILNDYLVSLKDEEGQKIMKSIIDIKTGIAGSKSTGVEADKIIKTN